ncbi:hypothetical protein PR202_ga16869 [Eleusine coracana subsp. coracana]|uniref:UDP-glycosyltransferases domain-containing protein n=1 Tax=Eleusine coracana subsp. coracana TaxID=191504 RepID=A0AAV5CNJ0_ELECO|nr:hypothetical protein PR202_ga16869 [Eleusine coracana subsp. coracana]
MDKEAIPTKQQTVVLYPIPFVGHVLPMLQLAKVFLRHGYNITMVLVELPVGSPDFGAGVTDRIRALNKSISFHVLPAVSYDHTENSSKPPLLVLLQLMRRYNDALQAFLCSIPRRRLHSLVTCMFSAHAADVAAKLRVPVYTFFASSASLLAVVAQLPPLLAGRKTGLKDLGEEPMEFLGVPPFPASHLMPSFLLDPEDDMFRTMISVLKRCTGTDGILVNTFQSLESRAVQTLSRDDLQCVPGRVLPPVYCVGPLVSEGACCILEEGGADRHECLTWLDAQPELSVVFICFGSLGLISAEQLREIAIGLGKPGQRFLWSVRKPVGTDDSRNLDAFLPKGFLEQTKDRGFVVESWIPQADVLQHPSTGAFLTHCGWNSTLEAITNGVPLLCWPLYAEQKFNKVLITDVMGIGVEMEGYRTGFINAKEVEGKVRLVIESREGKELRAQALACKNEAKAALEDNGSSQAAFVQFLADPCASRAPPSKDSFVSIPQSNSEPDKVLAVVTQLPEVLAGRQEGLKALGDTPIEFRGVPPIPASHLVKDVLENPEEDELCKAEVDVWKRTVDTHGVLVNTLESLETRAVQALRDPHQRVVPGRVMPPIYCVGPLIGGGHGTSASADEAGVERHDECLIAWLPNRSVVFLCFGSRGTHSAEQIREIAGGLDKSGQRFPDGFLERTKHRGIVVESWAFFTTRPRAHS